MLRAAVFLAFSAAALAQTPTVSAVVNSASYSTTLCPGLLASVYGSNFGSSAASITVTVGGKPAYVTLVTPSQMSVEIPFEVSPGSSTLTVTVAGTASAAFPITLSAVSPSFLTQNSSGSGLALVYAVSGNPPPLITLTAPAHAADILVAYAVGLGATSPITATGPATAANQVAPLPTVTVGGVSAKVLFAGVSPGLTGVYQINFTVPTGAQGTQPLVMSIGGQTSSTSVTVALFGLTAMSNNASGASPGTASPGSIATVYANGLATSTDVLSGLFPATKAGGVQLTFNGEAAPMFGIASSAAYPQQVVNVLVPADLPTSGTVNVQLTTSAAFYPNYPLTMVPANPGFYRLPDPKVAARQNVIAQFNNTTWLALPVSTTAALGLPACTPTTGALTECGQPATIGDYLVIYMTGLGLTTPNGDPKGAPLPTGQVPPANGSVLYETPTKPTVTIGGQPATVLFSGLAPGVAGEYQLDVQVPAGVTSGDDVPVVINMLGGTDTATVSIQPRP